MKNTGQILDYLKSKLEPQDYQFVIRAIDGQSFTLRQSEVRLEYLLQKGLRLLRRDKNLADKYPIVDALEQKCPKEALEFMLLDNEEYTKFTQESYWSLQFLNEFVKKHNL